MSQTLSRRLRTGLFYALRTAFRITPMPEATRDKLRQRFLDRHSNLIPPGPKGQVSEGVRVRRPYVRSDERAIGYVPYSQGELPDPLPATLIAFYLPQFHTIPENDEWWGKGFTEWRNVTRALPQFEGHHQPKLPGDLGFYDLRNPEVMREQARLAREYGISAFCFYFYWFGGKTLLETPLRNWLNDKTIDLKFCLCWANEKWTRTWDGRGDEILIDQKHSAEDDLAFIAHVAEYMRDPRYLRFGGKPMLLVYRPGLFPSMTATAARWRKWCLENDIGEIHLAYVQSFERLDPRTISFDATVEFPPNLSSSSTIFGKQRLINLDYSGEVLDWREMAQAFQLRKPNDYTIHAGVNPGWDNESRRPAKGRTFLYSSPRLYRAWLTQAIAKHSPGAGNAPLIFINAWNEWAEGATLEPDSLLGYANLQATRHALQSSDPVHNHVRNERYAVVHVWYIDVFEEIMEQLALSGISWHLVVTTPERHAAIIREKAAQSDFPFEIIVVENRGRDILPFLHIANRLLDEGVDVILKIHTKRSTHRENGDRWRRELLDQLVSEQRAMMVSKAFDAAPELGLVGPEGHVLPLARYMGDNKDTVAKLLQRMGLTMPDGSTFISGSMFWVRLRALQALLDLPLRESDFEIEQGQIDGTLAHALERVFGVCVDASGFQVKSVASICGYTEPATSPYRFAKDTEHF